MENNSTCYNASGASRVAPAPIVSKEKNNRTAQNLFFLLKEWADW